MGWGHGSLTLPGSSSVDIKVRFCAKCESDQPESGGVQMTPKRWSCAKCWKNRMFQGYARRPKA